MKKSLKLAGVLFLSLGFQATAQAFFIDFENGTDGAAVNDITGVSFQSFNGFDAIYGDSCVTTYNTTSDDGGCSNGGGYHHYGDKWLWAGPNATAQGVIVDFTNNDGTWFTTGYAANSLFYVDAYLTDGSMVSVVGANNYGSPMSFLSVNATTGNFIDYLVLHDSGNYWLVDNMSGDASGVNVPEPSTLAMLGLGIVGFGFMRRRQGS